MQRSHVFGVLFVCKVSFEKNAVLPFEKCPSLLLARNAIMLQHLVTANFRSINYLSSARLQEVKNK